MSTCGECKWWDYGVCYLNPVSVAKLDHEFCSHWKSKAPKPRTKKADLPPQDESFKSIWALRRADPGATDGGRKQNALAEWNKLTTEEKNACGSNLQDVIFGRAKAVGNGKDIVSLPHLERWIRDRRWE